MKKAFWSLLVIFPKLLKYIEKSYVLNKLHSIPNAKIDKSLRIGKDLFLRIEDNVKINIGKNVRINDNCILKIKKNAELILKDNAFISDNVSINCVEKIIMGENSAIADGGKIYDHNHAFTTTPKYEWKVNEFNTAPVIIGNNVKIYSDVTILKGVTIGDNCIIGCGCIIYKDVPANSIVIGKQEQIIKEIK